MKKHIPNLITLLNLLCGCIATVFAASNELTTAGLFVFLGIVFDFFDGLSAKVLDVRSELGLQLDSLADMVTSGLVPGLVMFQLLMNLHPENNIGVAIGDDITLTMSWMDSELNLVPFLGFLITLGAAYRLAKFNIDENQTTSFIGLPTPANAILILSFPLILEYQNIDWINDLIRNKWFLISSILLSTFLMNANIPLFGLKFKSLKWKENKTRYLFLILSLLIIIVLKFIAIPLIIVLYILLSILNNKKVIAV